MKTFWKDWDQFGIRSATSRIKGFENKKILIKEKKISERQQRKK